MAQNFADKMAARKLLLGMRAEALFGMDEASQQAVAAKPPQRCLRLNPLVTVAGLTHGKLIAAGAQLLHPDWLPENCYIINGSQPPQAEAALQAALADGAAFLQNPSSFVPVLTLDPQPGETILDLCASPGGKASYIAALTNNQAELWLNDTSFDRLQRLKRVCGLLHASAASYTLVKGEAASKHLPLESFDKILVDAPCSGEDIRLATEPDLGSWSPAKVKRLAELQKKLLKEAWKLLKPSGTLVYSTCSQAPEEDEAVVSWFLSKHESAATIPITSPVCIAALTSWNTGAFHPGTERAVRIKPDASHISFFACKFTKSGAED